MDGDDVELVVEAPASVEPLPEDTPEATAEAVGAAVEPYTTRVVAAATDLVSDGLGLILGDARWAMTEQEHNWIDPGLHALTMGTRAERIIAQAPKGRLAIGVVAWLRRRLDYLRDDIAAWRAGLSVEEYLRQEQEADHEPRPGPGAGGAPGVGDGNIRVAHRPRQGADAPGVHAGADAGGFRAPSGPAGAGQGAANPPIRGA
jgi:hypothetical protein